MTAYIGVKVREEAYNCNKCDSLKMHLEVCTLRNIKESIEVKTANERERIRKETLKHLLEVKPI